MTKMVPFLIKDGLLDLGATCLLKGQELGVHGQRPVDDRPESGLVGPNRSTFHRDLDGVIIKGRGSCCTSPRENLTRNKP
jgi:hypothetical protein